MAMELTPWLVFSWIMAINSERSWDFQQKSWGHCGSHLLLIHLPAVAVAWMGLCPEYLYQSYWWIRWVHKLRCVGKKFFNYCHSAPMLQELQWLWWRMPVPSLLFAASFKSKQSNDMIVEHLSPLLLLCLFLCVKFQGPVNM